MVINIISDTSGHATEHLVNKTIVQFDIKVKIKVYPYVDNMLALEKVLNQIKEQEQKQILYNSIQDSKMNVYIDNFCDLYQIDTINLMGFSINKISEVFGIKPKENYDKNNFFESEFFRKMNALDFAIKYDDGKDFRSLKTCDIALIGVSRSSKTPTSMYLASKGYKVSNIPILLGNNVPRELYEIDNKKIFGLDIDPNVLREYRLQRLKSLKLSTDSQYSDKKRIDEELAYAKEIMEDLDCTIIDITNKSIEETSEIIINKLKNLERGNKSD
ncbi:MAG: pyruvate, water dikinase regulatory protein [Anaerococcus sp.]|nr:kinase/pyrophosphorylase [Peptoniphilaceae bacterium]MDY3054700.1 pyruvate, water dikinase regulatory protein [Anaerococcus sp.]